MRTRWLVAALVLAAGGNTSALSPDLEETVALGVVLARARQYVREFESAFALVVADEAYTQDVQIGQGSLPPPPVSRRIQSEMLFMWVAEDRHWLSIRNVLVVNGKRVADSESGLEQALKQPLPERESRLHRLAEHSARFNIGSIYRNFNNPTLAMQFLDSSYQSHFMFTMRAQEPDGTIDGAPTRKIEFAEVEHPTLIREQGQDRPAAGVLSVRVADGTVVRTTLRLPGRTTTPDASIAVDYRRDPKLGMWVPSRMEELYRTVVVADNPGSTMRSVTRFNTIHAVATYSNFRRFETSGRVITPK